MRPIRCIYVSYDGLLDPLGQSQILPYLFGLTSNGYSIDVLSFEKASDEEDKVKVLETKLNEKGIQWYRLKFEKRRYSFVFRTIAGALTLRKLCSRQKYNLIHLRGLQSAIIYYVSMLKLHHIYDIRGFLGEWIDEGRISKNSLFHRTVAHIDRRIVETASGLVVLEEVGKASLYEIYSVPKIPIAVIRTCTEVSRYPVRNSLARTHDSGPVRFVYLGGTKLPYRVDLALLFVNNLIKTGITCSLDVITGFDQRSVSEIAEEVGFPKESLNIYRLDHAAIPEVLCSFDCGLIFNNASPWRKLSSPTKLGEYLAAGLVVLALPGIQVVDDFAERSHCVVIISESEIVQSDLKRINLIDALNTPGISENCRELARNHFDLAIANAKYANLYTEVGSLLNNPDALKK